MGTGLSYPGPGQSSANAQEEGKSCQREGEAVIWLGLTLGSLGSQEPCFQCCHPDSPSRVGVYCRSLEQSIQGLRDRDGQLGGDRPITQHSSGSSGSWGGSTGCSFSSWFFPTLHSISIKS